MDHPKDHSLVGLGFQGYILMETDHEKLRLWNIYIAGQVPRNDIDQLDVVHNTFRTQKHICI